MHPSKPKSNANSSIKAFLFPLVRMNATPLGSSSTVYTFLWQYFYCTVLSLQFACLSSLCPRYKLLNYRDPVRFIF